MDESDSVRDRQSSSSYT